MSYNSPKGILIFKIVSILKSMKNVGDRHLSYLTVNQQVKERLRGLCSKRKPIASIFDN